MCILLVVPAVPGNGSMYICLTDLHMPPTLIALNLCNNFGTRSGRRIYFILTSMKSKIMVQSNVVVVNVLQYGF